MNIILIAFIVITIVLIRFSASNIQNNSYLSLDTSYVLRGVLSIVVIIHHVSLRIDEGIILKGFNNVGCLAVSLFFFYSGYGLMKKYNKNNSYKKGFIRKRILPIVILYIWYTIIYYIINVIDGEILSLAEIIKNTFIHGQPIVTYSWYIFAIVIFYFCFYFSTILCGNNCNRIIICNYFFVSIYIFICIILKYGNWMYNTALIFPVGITWGMYENNISNYLKRRYCIKSCCTVIFFSCLFIFQWKLKDIINISEITFLLDTFISLSFCLIVFFFLIRINISSSFFSCLGKISLEIYLSQGLLFQILRSRYIYIYNNIIYACMVILLTVCFAYLINILHKKIMSKLFI